MSYSYYIWKRLYDRKLRTQEEIETATSIGILSIEEKDSILNIEGVI